MSDKPQQPQRTGGHKTSGGHGSFKHTAQGTDLDAVVGAYKLSRSDLKRVREMVVGKETAHAR